MIHDTYTAKPVSRQRKYQLRMRDKNKCITCGKPAVNSHFCKKHREIARERAIANYHDTKDL
jgi:hypothetical protein